MNIATFKMQLQQAWRFVAHMRIALFIVFLTLLYVGITWRIQTLASIEPTSEAVAAEAHASSKPKIDQDLVNKIKQLEDTNVTVKALFDQARKSPFRE